MAGEVRWDKERVTVLFTDASMKVLTELAFKGEERTKINVSDNDQIDTGFMMNSVYVVAPSRSDYEPNIAKARSLAVAARKKREAAPKAPLPDAKTVLLAVAAIYAVQQELRKSFLYKALLSLAADFNGTVEKNKL